MEAGRELFWEKGYTATGLAEILERAEANSGSFYYYFDSKDALLRTVLSTYLELLDEQIVKKADEASPAPIGRLFALLEGYRRRLVDTGYRYGCPIGRLALEVDSENAPALKLIGENFAAWKRAIETYVRAAGLSRAPEIAALVLAVMEGGVMQARAQRSIKPFDACVRQLRVHLDAARQESDRRTRKRRAR